MDDAVMREMEATLRSYYKKIEELQGKRRALETVEKNAEDVRRLLQDANQLVPSNGTVAKYSFAAGGPSRMVSDPTAQAYQEYSRTVENLQRELVMLLPKKMKLKMQIIQLEAAVDRIGFALNLLDPIERTICEQYYGLRRKSNLQIGLALNMDEKTIRYRKKSISKKLSEYLRLSPSPSQNPKHKNMLREEVEQA